MEVGRQAGELIPYQIAKIKDNPVTPGRHSLADAVVLRVKGVADRVVLIPNDGGAEFTFSARQWVKLSEPVRVCLSNFHDTLHDSPRGLIDFLWYYYSLKNLKDKDNKRPKWEDLFIPWIPHNLSGKVTGSSGHCPPIAVNFGDATAWNLDENDVFGEIKLVGNETNPIVKDCVLIRRMNTVVGSGVLVAKNMVLTAGHVLDEHPTGISYLEIRDKERKEINVTFMEGVYAVEGDADLLLYRLLDDVDADICARAASGEIGSEIRAVGFGFSDTGTDRTQREACLDVVSLDCGNPGEPKLYSCNKGKTLVAKGKKGEKLMLHDSGSPAYVTVDGMRKVAGIGLRVTSGTYSIYALLHASKKWIDDNIKDLQARESSVVGEGPVRAITERPQTPPKTAPSVPRSRPSRAGGSGARGKTARPRRPAP